MGGRIGVRGRRESGVREKEREEGEVWEREGEGGRRVAEGYSPSMKR